MDFKRALFRASTPILQLVEQINQSFEKNKFTVGVLVDLSKAFHTVDHQILLKKIEYYGIAGNNLKWFENYHG